jgi:predicted chitinase
MTGKAKEVGKAIEEAGITSPSAVQALVATAAKESGLDPKSKETGAKGWLNTLSGRGLSYIYNKFPQLGPGGRVAKLLGMPNGVPADYLQSAWSKGDEAFFEMVYGGSSTNPQPGDGYKFRGRGFIQITGRNVYKNIGKAMGENFESNPDAVSSDFGAAAKAMVGYIVNSVGQGNSKKGFDFLNSLTDFKTALKVIIGNVAMGNLGSNMEKIESAYTTSKLAATNVGQLDAAAKYENIAKASTDVASGQRQQAKPSTPVNINASTTNNTKINKNEMAAASKPRDTAGMLAARAT